VLLITLLWLLHRNEIDEQRSTLIADVLWLEQSVRFHLEGNSEQLQQLALDLTRARNQGELFDLRARHILKNNPNCGSCCGSTPRPGQCMACRPRPCHVLNTRRSGENPVSRSVELARLGKPIYSDAYRTAETAQFEVYVPIFDDGQYRGTLLGVYSLTGCSSIRSPGGSPRNTRSACRRQRQPAGQQVEDRRLADHAQLPGQL
jgi:two-component system sensor histidine kinase DctS